MLEMWVCIIQLEDDQASREDDSMNDIILSAVV